MFFNLQQETALFVAEKYSAAPASFTAFIEDEHWPHTHVNQLRAKLNQFDWNRIGSVNYESLKTMINMRDEEMYEIGATALDSSIMLTFQKTDETNSSE